MEFTVQHKQYIADCEQALQKAADTYFQPKSAVGDAALYSLLSGGKRVRGVFVLAACEMLGGSYTAAKHLAAAIEMMHAFSLIHDDLPCMDDDDMRRGQPACHIAFGEATALLAGDALSITAFSAAANCGLPPAYSLDAISALANGAGPKGMIYGQELDMGTPPQALTLEKLNHTHNYKTGCLFRSAFLLGIACAQQKPQAHKAIMNFADNIGLVFQIVDDILDVTATPQQLGKPIGSDKAQGKITYVNLLGITAAKAQALQLTNQAIQQLTQEYGSRASFLCKYAQELASRIN